MSDPRPPPRPRDDNEHPINTGHPNVARDGQYPPLERTIGEETGAVSVPKDKALEDAGKAVGRAVVSLVEKTVEAMSSPRSSSNRNPYRGERPGDDIG